mmetsp:Transcript_4844/g.14716  ORF Transcript_4844/g.14716 Transcript_4844/m.14716 type:complete len:135 (+) Transcript_4844:1391-1795(+)
MNLICLSVGMLVQEPVVNVTEAGSPIPQRGEPGRWALPDDPSGMEALAALYRSLEGLRTNRTVFAMLVCASLIALIGRLLAMCTFQPRLAIIPMTLWLAAGEIVQLVLVLVPMAMMWAMMMTLTAVRTLGGGDL